MDAFAVEQALVLDAQWVEALRRAWLALLEETVWGEIRGWRPGQSGRVRRRALEAGERLRSLTAGRDWIPRPREKLKNALASALAAEEALAAIEREAGTLQGPDLARFQNSLSHLRSVLDQHLPGLKTRWAELLDAA